MGDVLVATLAGMVIVAFTINPEHVSTPALIALLMVAVAAWLDSQSTNLTRPEQMYLSQGMIAFAGALFLPAALLAGFPRAIKMGQEYIVSFIVLFSTGQVVGRAGRLGLPGHPDDHPRAGAFRRTSSPASA